MSNKWIEIDAKGESFGRLASKLALILQGKQEPTYDPSKIQAPNVVVINCAGLKISERRADSTYYSHSGYLGSMREKKFTDQPVSQRLKSAVNNMLPKNKSRKDVISHLKCFEDSEHPFKSQTK